MHAVIAILAALVRRGADRRGRLPRRLGRRRRARAHVALHRRVPRHRRRARPAATTSSPAATPATTSTAARDGKWLAVGAIEPHFYAQPLPSCSAASSGPSTSTTTTCRTEIRADFRAAFATRDRDDWVASSAPADTCVSRGRTRCPSWSTIRTLAARDVVRRRARTRPSTATSARSGCVLAGHATRRRPTVEVRDARRSPTPTSCWPPPGSTPRTDRRPAEPKERSRERPRPTASPSATPSARSQYEEAGEFPVERGYIWTTLLVGRERQPAVLGRRGRRRDHRRPDRAADDALGLVPPAPLGAGPHGAGAAAAGPLRPQGALRPARGGHDRQHDRLPRAGAPRRRAAHPPDPAVGERAEDHQARHRPLLGDRRRVPQPARRAGRRRDATPASATSGRRRHEREPTKPHRSTTCTRATRCPSCATTSPRPPSCSARSRAATGGRCTTTTTSRSTATAPRTSS